jgi:hypothetical protein
MYFFLLYYNNHKIHKNFKWELRILYKTKSFSSLSGKQNSNKETPNRGIENSIPLVFNSLRKFPLQALFRTLPSGYGRVYTLHTPEGREGEFSWGGGI